MKKKKIVIFSGAGISAESGLKTFRDSGGLWEEYRVEDVATPEAWEENPARVTEFYNKRRRQVLDAKPNAAHFALVELEKKFEVHIITQNIDDLHERAGSKRVLHLHGEITKSRSSIDPGLIYSIKGATITMGDTCELGSQLRPHVVWFGERVPEMENACKIASTADIFVIIGTSLNVYPAASLIDFVPVSVKKYLI
ncbi:MAG TPA: Sir2 family NAD-dependent protein deacetylase, partial [Bacteroidia bacterium]